MLYYDRIVIRSSHCAVRKGVVGREDVTRFLCSFVDSERIIAVVYHRVAIECSNSATGAEIVKKRDFGVGFVVIRFFR